MFRSKNIFKDLYEYVNELDNQDTCKTEPIIKQKQIGGTTHNKLNNRKYIGLELNPEYAILANERISKVGGIFT